MRKLNFGIIGFGKMGVIRYNALKNIPACKVSWICDIRRSVNFPKNIRHTKNFNDILDDSEVDAIIVCTSNDVIKDIVVKGLSKSKHVFSEKPPGRNLQELNEMIRAEARYPQMKLMFGFNHRHHDSMILAKRRIDSGEYGRILWMRGRYGKSVDGNFFSTWRSSKKKAGGGILLDQGIHMVDLFLMMCGDFEEVMACVSNLYWKLDVEDNVFAILRNKKGQVASLHSTMTQWRHLFSLEIFMERGYITVNGLKTSSNSYGDEAMSIAKNRSAPPAAVWTKEEDLVFHVDNSWGKELKIFVNSIRNNKPIPVGNTKDALKVMTLIDKIYKER